MSGTKEHFLDRFAERFQKAGFAALVFDHRYWGASDGLPRHHTNHYEQTQDTHDVIYYASRRPDVDPTRIVLWGSSYSGGIAIMAGAVDPRVKAVVTQVPSVTGSTTRKRLPAEVLDRIYADRGATTTSNPTYIPVWPESLEQARTPGNGVLLGTEECWDHHQVVQRFGHEKENKITLQSMFHAIRSEPRAFICSISPRPLFMAVGAKDSILSPQLQLEAFDQAGEPKQFLELDCGHFGAYRSHFEENVSAQIRFLEKYL